jgi:membrane glycosyltransferase
MIQRVLRGGLALLGVLHLSWGIAATTAPKWFFETFPGFGERWTAAYPPYNEHLLVDVGAAFTALGVLLLTAAVLADRRVTTVVLLGVIVFSGLHLAFHARDHGGLSGMSLSLSLTSLVAGVLAPLALLVLARRPRR